MHLIGALFEGQQLLSMIFFHKIFDRLKCCKWQWGAFRNRTLGNQICLCRKTKCARMRTERKQVKE